MPNEWSCKSILYAERSVKMKFTPVYEISYTKRLFIFSAWIAFMLFWNEPCFYIISLIAIPPLMIRLFIDVLRWNRFQSSPKETTQAKIVDRRIVEHSGKHGPSYTHYITYQFEDLAHGRTFTFEEKVSQKVYNRVSIGTLLTVEYVIADPTLALRCY